MEIVVVVIILLVVGVWYITKKGNDTTFLGEVEAMPNEAQEELSIEGIKVDWFNQLYKLTWYREEDNTEGFYIQDKKTHAILGYVAQDGVVRQVKQTQSK